jgi:hypothetical protein
MNPRLMKIPLSWARLGGLSDAASIETAIEFPTYEAQMQSLGLLFELLGIQAP